MFNTTAISHGRSNRIMVHPTVHGITRANHGALHRPGRSAAIALAMVVSAAASMFNATAASAATTRYEAENARLSGGTQIASDHTGYSGSGFVGGYIDAHRGTATTTFTTNAPSATSYALNLRYANGTGQGKTLSLSIDGGSPQQIALPATAGWDSWSTFSRTAPLSAGSHTLVLQFGNGDSGNVNLDWLSLTSATAPPPSPPPSSGPLFEAEAAALAGGANVQTDHSSHTGSGFVGGFTDSNRGNAAVTFAVSRGQSGPVDLALRYANGTGTTRTFSLLIDGMRQQIALPPTSGWDAWQNATVSTTLSAGNHSISYRYGDADSGNANLDSLTVTAAQAPPPPPPPVDPPATPNADEAEAAFVSGGATLANAMPGFSGTGYVRGFNTRGARIVRTLSMAAAGNAQLSFRTASPNGSARSLALIVNGRHAGSVALPGSGTWQSTNATVALRAGINTMQLASDGPGADVLVDSMTFSGDRALAARGATVPYTEYEAESASTNAALIGPDRTYGTLASEASGRRAVQLSSTGDHVDFNLTQPANAIVVRFSIPDSADGKGLTAPLSLYANGRKIKDLSLSSIYSRVYGPYPYNNDPNQGGAHRFYDEVRAQIGQWPAGTILSLQKDSGDTAASYTIDLVDAEVAPAAFSAPPGAISITDKGAKADGSDATDAIRSAISAAASAGVPVWIPSGTFRITQRINMAGVTMLGAGPWYSALQGTDGKGGLFAVGSNVTIADLSILGDVRYRNDSAFDTGIEGNFGEGSLVQNVWIEHTKVGMWIDSGTRGLDVVGTRIRDTFADGVNIHADVVGTELAQSTLRNTGDDALAMFSQGSAVTRSAYRFNTVQLPILANGIGIYGGNANAATDNIVSDTVTAASGIAVGTRFNPVPLSGTTIIARNTLNRTGSREVNWQTNLGALWIYADTADITSPIEVTDMVINDSTFQAVLISFQRSVRNLSFNRVKINKAGTYAFELNATGSADVSNTTVSGAAAGGVLNESGYVLNRASGNSGF